MFPRPKARVRLPDCLRLPPVLNRGLILISASLALTGDAAAGSLSALSQFRHEVQPVLQEYCYDCHGDGAKKGGVAFDELTSNETVLNPALWLRVLKNVRAGLMPPANKPRPSPVEEAKLERWIKGEAFGIDPAQPDPGRVTLRRLNRVEYRNTIQDLMGFDFKVEDELPPDDTGYGFDNIGDVLSLSPLLLEKYMQAAELITAAAVPRTDRAIAEKTLNGASFKPAQGTNSGERISFYSDALVTNSFQANHAGHYKIGLDLEVAGQFDFDPGRCQVLFRADDAELLAQELGWQNGKKFHFDYDQTWSKGDHSLSLEVIPLVPREQKKNSLDLKLLNVRIQGPTEEKYWVRPKNFALFFTKDLPSGSADRDAYARGILERFATRAYRRPVEKATVDRLVEIAQNTYHQPDKRFEDGIAQALVPILASPRFLFRVEGTEPSGVSGNVAWVDEYSLASRLSYFLWSTMPDRELMDLAGRHELRQDLPHQLRRMLADHRSEALVRNFIGQWLQTRDLEGIDINARVVLSRDSGEEGDFARRRRRFQELNGIPEEKRTPEQKAELQRMFEQRRRRFGNRPQVELDRDLRRAMREETEMSFAYVLRENRSALELVDANYTFLNEKLATHYGLTNLDVKGPEMRRVTLPEDSPRGGILTEGSVLVVTSNPTRTSPVKRGLFILDNILGLPTPPPPPNIPNLEDSDKPTDGRQPTLREVLAIHRDKPLCASCHNRMDPLGLALENFNALGMWRTAERNQPIDAAGKLITGEEFHDIREVKHALVTAHRLDFYRCLTEKMLTYALGRGLEYYDTETIDKIVTQLDSDQGRISALLTGIIDSAPFQKARRSAPIAAAANSPGPIAQATSTP